MMICYFCYQKCPECASINNPLQIDSKDRLCPKTRSKQKTQVNHILILLFSSLKKRWHKLLKWLAWSHTESLTKSCVWSRAAGRKPPEPQFSASPTVHPSFSEHYHVITYYSKLLTSLNSSLSYKWRSGHWQKVIIALDSKDYNCLCRALCYTFCL